MQKISFLLLGTSLSLVPQTISAAECAVTDCSLLGYTDSPCPGSGLKCPFGDSWYCGGGAAEDCIKLGYNKSCTGAGENGNGETCNGKYQSCTCDSSYKYTCSGTGYSGGSGSACGGKYTSCTCASGWIMTVSPIQTGIAWDTGSRNQTNIADSAASASCTNTQKLVALGSRFAAANAANNYKPTGTPSEKSWCLPSYDLLNSINNSTNLAKINTAITTAGGTKLGYGGQPSYSYESVWSSSEYVFTDGAWYLYVSTSSSSHMDGNGRNNSSINYTVRPVLEF